MSYECRRAIREVVKMAEKREREETRRDKGGIVTNLILNRILHDQLDNLDRPLLT